MIKCRARTIRGDAVSFDYEERLIRSPLGDAYVAEFVGEGFHAVSEVGRYWGDRSSVYVMDRHRLALDRAGIDTATAQRWEAENPTVAWIRAGGNLAGPWGRWVPLFPPVIKEMPADFPMPGHIVYVETDPGMPEKPDDALIAAMKDASPIFIDDHPVAMRALYGAIRRHLLKAAIEKSKAPGPQR